MGEVHAEDPVARLEDAEVGGHVGLGARMGLDVDVLGARVERQRPLLGEQLGDVDELAAAVVALAGQALGVLVRQPAALGLHDGGGDVVLARDQLDVVVLAAALALHRRPELRVDLGDGLERKAARLGDGHRVALLPGRYLPTDDTSSDRGSWTGHCRDAWTRPLVSASARATIDTPALVVDIDRVDAAIARMASGMAERGVALRPHAKTHKSIEVGRRQIAAGAVGLTVGTIGEAEVFADGGLDDLFIAYPLVPLGPKAARLRALARTARLRLGVSTPSSVLTPSPMRWVTTSAVSPLLLEIDSGGRRTGVAPDDAGPVAAAATPSRTRS